MIFSAHSVFNPSQFIFGSIISNLSFFSRAIVSIWIYYLLKSLSSFFSSSNPAHEIFKIINNIVWLQVVYHFQSFSNLESFTEMFDSFEYTVPKSFNKLETVFLLQIGNTLELSTTYVFNYDNKTSLSWSIWNSNTSNHLGVSLNIWLHTLAFLKRLFVGTKNEAIFQNGVPMQI